MAKPLPIKYVDIITLEEKLLSDEPFVVFYTNTDDGTYARTVANLESLIQYMKALEDKTDLSRYPRYEFGQVRLYAKDMEILHNDSSRTNFSIYLRRHADRDGNAYYDVDPTLNIKPIKVARKRGHTALMSPEKSHRSGSGSGSGSGSRSGSRPSSGPKSRSKSKSRSGSGSHSGKRRVKRRIDE